MQPQVSRGAGCTAGRRCAASRPWAALAKAACVLGLVARLPCDRCGCPSGLPFRRGSMAPAALGPIGADDGGQHVVIDDDRVTEHPRLDPSSRRCRVHLLALESDLVRWRARPGCRAQRRIHASLVLRHELARDDCNHPGWRRRRWCRWTDARVSMWAAQDRHMEHAGKDESST